MTAKALKKKPPGKLLMLHCPFCGSDKVEVWTNHSGSWGKCLACAALGPFVLGGSKRAAAKEWNDRDYSEETVETNEEMEGVEEVPSEADDNEDEPYFGLYP